MFYHKRETCTLVQCIVDMAYAIADLDLNKIILNTLFNIQVQYICLFIINRNLT